MSTFEDLMSTFEGATGTRWKCRRCSCC